MMATNPFFQQGFVGEQDLLEDLMTESIQIHGRDLFYLPRTVNSTEKVLLDPQQAVFNHAIPLEFYIESFDGFANAIDLFQKFGIEIRDQHEFRVMRKRFEEEVMSVVPGAYQPKEGDLIYFPLVPATFVVRFVEDHDRFFQLDRLYSYLLKTENHEYSGEVFNTGIDEIDKIEWQWAPSIVVDCKITTTNTEEQIRQKLKSGTLFYQEIENSTEGLRINCKLYNILSLFPHSTETNTWNVQIKVGFLHFNEAPSETDDFYEQLKYDKKILIPSETNLLIPQNPSSLSMQIVRVADYQNLFHSVEELGPDDHALPEFIHENDIFAQNQTLEKEADKVINFDENNPFGKF
jgi:hypothetical protein